MYHNYIENISEYRLMISSINEEDCQVCENIGKLSLPIYYKHEDLLELLENPDYTLLKSKTKNKNIVGIIIYRKTIIDQTHSYINHIMSIAVHPDYRRKNIGSHLMNAVKSKNKPISLYVQTINKNATNFYKKHGFIILSKIDDYYESLKHKAAHLMIYGNTSLSTVQ